MREECLRWSPVDLAQDKNEIKELEELRYKQSRIDFVPYRGACKLTLNNPVYADATPPGYVCKDRKDWCNRSSDLDDLNFNFRLHSCFFDARPGQTSRPKFTGLVLGWIDGEFCD